MELVFVQGCKIMKNFKSLITVVCLSLFAALSMGIEGCSEPKEYCKDYRTTVQRSECASFCADPKRGYKSNKDLIRACEYGQYVLLFNSRQGQFSANEVLVKCDHEMAAPSEFAKACRDGVIAEDLRLSETSSGPGTSSDRETGNRR